MVRELAVEEDGVRLDKYLSVRLADLTRSYLQKLLKDGDITVNGGTVKSNYKVRCGDRNLLCRLL